MRASESIFQYMFDAKVTTHETDGTPLPEDMEILYEKNITTLPFGDDYHQQEMISSIFDLCPHNFLIRTLLSVDSINIIKFQRGKKIKEIEILILNRVGRE